MSRIHDATNVTELLQSLVSSPSVNPELASAAEHEQGVCGEEALALELADYFEALNYEVKLDYVEPARPNLIARAPRSEGKPRMLFGPHLDTVRIDNMVIPPFDAAISDGKLWGRGASDTKGPMAAMIWAIREHHAKIVNSPVAIDFVAFMGEETQQLGSKHFAKNYASDYEFAIVGEPTELQIVNRTKGCLWATLNAKGTSVHASEPSRGKNAIWELLRDLEALWQPLESQLQQFGHPILGESTVNLGTIQGGVSPNIVPNAASLTLDLRTTPDLWAKGGASAMLNELVTHLEISSKLTFKAENPPMEIQDDHPWVRAIQNVHPSSKCVGAPWFSDAAHLNQEGLASICLGPGSIRQAHTKDEFIQLDDLKAGSQFFSALIEHWINAKS